MGCLKIEVKSNDTWIELITFLDSEFVTVDAENGETNNFFKVNTARGLRVPYNANKIILDQLINENRNSNECIYLETRVWDKCANPLEYTHCYVDDRSKSKENSSYNVVFVDKETNPIAIAEEKYLCDFLSSKTYELNKQVVEQSWQNHKNGMLSTSTFSPVVFALSCRGATYCGGNNFAVDDVVPWFHPLAGLRDIFCEMGFTFMSTLWDDPMWQKNYVTLNDSTLGSGRAFDPSDFVDQYSLNGPITINPVDDEGNLIDTGGFLGFGETSVGYQYLPFLDFQSGSNLVTDSFTVNWGSNVSVVQRFFIDNCFIRDFDFEWCIDWPANTITGYELRLQAIRCSDNTIIAFDDVTIEPGTVVNDNNNAFTGFIRYTGTLTIGSDLFKYCGVNEDCFYLRFCATGDGDGLNNNEWENGPPQLKILNLNTRVIKRKHCEGDIVTFAEIFSCEKKVSDLLMDLVIMSEGRFLQNKNLCSFALLPAFTTEYSEGYYKEGEWQDITHLVTGEQVSTKGPRKQQQRCLLYGFKESTDPCVTENSKYETVQPYEYLYCPDGASETNKQSRRLKCFEPTLTKELQSGSGSPVHLSCLTGTGEGVNTDFNFRIGQFVCSQQTYLNDSGTPIGQATLVWCDQEITDIPTIIQSIDGENFTQQGFDESCSLTFKRLFFKYIIRYVQAVFNSKFTDVLLSLNCYDLSFIDYRKGFQYSYCGTLVQSYFNKLTKQHCAQTGLLNLINFSDQDCGLDEETNINNCLNVPEIICFKDDNGCLNYMLGGVNNSVVNSITWEADLYDPVLGVFPQTYNYPINQNSINSAIICDAPCLVRVRMTVSYEGSQGEICPECVFVPISVIVVNEGLGFYEVAININDPSCNLTGEAPDGATQSGQGISFNVPLSGYQNPNPGSFFANGLRISVVCDNGCDGSMFLSFPAIQQQEQIGGFLFTGISTSNECEQENTFCPPVIRTITKDPCGNLPSIFIACKSDDECNSCYKVYVSNNNAMSSVNANFEAITDSGNGLFSGSLLFTISPNGLEAFSQEICLNASEVFTLPAGYEISFTGNCKNYVDETPIEKQFQNCCCKPTGNCVDCKWTWVNDCGRKVSWYRISDHTDKNVVPFDLTQEIANQDDKAKDCIIVEYPKSGPVFLDKWDGWYVAVLDGGSCGCLLYPFYHDAPNSGTPVVTINV